MYPLDLYDVSNEPLYSILLLIIITISNANTINKVQEEEPQSKHHHDPTSQAKTSSCLHSDASKV